MNALERILIAMLLAGLTGCASIQDSHYRVAKWTEATTAYVSSHDSLANPFSDYGLGWREGYYCVATGGDGQLPPVPDCRYWGPGFQTEAGRARVNAWYNGFESGASVAEAACRGAYNEIPSSCSSFNDVPHPFPPHSCGDDIEHYLAEREQMSPTPAEMSPSDIIPPPPREEPARRLPTTEKSPGARARVEDSPDVPSKPKLSAPTPEPEILEYNESDEEE